MKLSEMGRTPPKIVMYGDVGTGKTAFALTCGRHALVCDFEDGLRSGLTLIDEFSKVRSEVEVRRFIDEDPGTRALAFAAFRRWVFELPPVVKSGRFPHRVIIIDSLTSMCEAAVRYVVGNSGAPTSSPKIQQWGLAFSEVKNVLAILRSVPVALILIAHDEVRTRSVGEIEENFITLAVSGRKMDKDVSRYFDEVWYCRARPSGGGKVTYSVQTVPDHFVVARSRSGLKGFNTSIGMPKVLEMLGYPLEDKEVTNVESTQESVVTIESNNERSN